VRGPALASWRKADGSSIASCQTTGARYQSVRVGSIAQGCPARHWSRADSIVCRAGPHDPDERLQISTQWAL